MPISFKAGLEIAEEHEPLAIEAIEALGFTLINHTTTVQNAKPIAERRYRDADGLIYPDMTFKDNETGRLLYVDSKAKSGPVYFFNEASWRHGNSAIPNYRKRSILENIPVIIVFHEPFIKEFIYRYRGKSSPMISIGGLHCINVLTPWIGQKYERPDLKYTKLVYYERSSLHPIKEIRSVAGWEA